MEYLFHNINWDTDGEDVANLPAQVVLNVPTGIDLALEGANLLSDKFGFCVNSFEFKPQRPEALLGNS